MSLVTVKPTKLKLTDLAIDPQDLMRALTSVASTVLDSMEKDFQLTCSTFDHKPTFTKVRPQRKGNKIEGSVSTDDPNYARLNYGTTSHVVGARRQNMSFHTGYRTKTVQYPHSARARPGGPFGPRIVRKGAWRVSGIQPRLFDFVVATHGQALLDSKLDQVLKKLTP